MDAHVRVQGEGAPVEPASQSSRRSPREYTIGRELRSEQSCAEYGDDDGPGDEQRCDRRWGIGRRALPIAGHPSGTPITLVESNGEDRACDQQDEGTEDDEAVVAPVERRELERNHERGKERHEGMVL